MREAGPPFQLYKALCMRAEPQTIHEKGTACGAFFVCCLKILPGETPAAVGCEKRRRQRLFKRRVRNGLCVALTCAMLSISASAAPETTPTAGTDVWLSVVPRPTQERISVTVPTVIAFVVNGTADETGDEAVTVENDGLLIPNVKVEGADGGNEYQLVTTGQSSLVVQNYSTNVREEDMDQENPTRYGIKVTLGATVVTAQDEDGEPVGPEQRADWTLTGTEPTTAQADFKKFRLSLDGKAFSKRVDANTYGMDGEIEVGAAPSDKYGWTAGGISKRPFEQEIELGVEVGGTRGMYGTVENSVKAAQIVWNVRALPLE